MGSSSSDDRLARAYQLIEANELDESTAILEPIIAEEPDNADAWWLYAHSVNDPQKAHEALDNVLRIDPAYPGANDLYRQLEEQFAQEAPPPPAPGGRISPIKPIAPPPPDLPPETELADLEEPFEFEDFGDTQRPVASTSIEFDRKEKKPKGGLPIRTIALVAIVAIVLLAALLAVFQSGIVNPPRPPSSTPTAGAVAMAETATEETAAATEAAETEAAETEVVETAEAMAAQTEAAEETEAIAPTQTKVPTTAPTNTAVETENETEEAEETETAAIAMAVETEEASPTKAAAETKPTMTATSKPSLTPTPLPPTATSTIAPTATTPPPTNTKAPTATETEEAVVMVMTEAMAAVTEETTIITEEAEETEAALVETEVASPVTEEPVSATEPSSPTAEVTPEVTVESGMPSANYDAVYSALSGYQVLRNGVLLSQSSLGNTLMVTVCSTAGLETRTNLVPIMNAIARQASGLDSSVDAIGTHLVNCTTGKSILIIVVDTTSAVEYAKGNLTDRDFQLAWKPQ